MRSRRYREGNLMWFDENKIEKNIEKNVSSFICAEQIHQTFIKSLPPSDDGSISGKKINFITQEITYG